MGLMKKLLERREGSRSGFGTSWDGPFDVSIEETGNTQRFSRSRNTEEMEAFNERLKACGAKVKGALPVSIASHGIGGKNLKRSIRNTYYYDFGEIYRLGFSFTSEGIFVYKVVGRGYVMRGGVGFMDIKKSQHKMLTFKVAGAGFEPTAFGL